MRVSADVLDAQSGGDRNAVELLGRLITPEIVRQVIQKASAVNWGAHFLRWRYFDVTHAGRAYHRGTLVATALWHLLKRIYGDQDWPAEIEKVMKHNIAYVGELHRLKGESLEQYFNRILPRCPGRHGLILTSVMQPSEHSIAMDLWHKMQDEIFGKA